MTTRYIGLDGSPTWEPIPTEVWTAGGQRVGALGYFESLRLTFTDRAAGGGAVIGPSGTELELLSRCDGNALLVSRVNGHTFVGVPVEAEVRSGADPNVSETEVTLATGWTLLDGATMPPSLDQNLTEDPALEFNLTGALESVIKSLIHVTVHRLGLPLVCVPDRGTGPVVTARGAWDNVGDLIRDLLAGTGYRLDLAGWVPGDPTGDLQATPSGPCLIADVVPYRRRDGLVFATVSGDITDWSVKRQRAVTTKAVVGYEVEDETLRQYVQLERPTASKWAVREKYLEYSAPDQIDDRDPDPIEVRYGMEETAVAELMAGGVTESVDVKVELGGSWRFTANTQDPRGYTVGDVATLELPGMPTLVNVVTEVEVEVTPTELTVTPTVSTPDTLVRDQYTAQAALARRVTQLERNK